VKGANLWESERLALKKVVKVPKVLHDKLKGKSVNKGKVETGRTVVRMMSSIYNRMTSI